MENLEKNKKVKYLFSLAISYFSLFLFSPLIILITAAIKLEGFFDTSAKGPIIHKELRVSEGNIFRIYKFRSVKMKFLDSIEKDSENKTISVIMNNRNSLTRVGKFLAKFYFDELAQFFNVIKGEMDIVGPRPQLPSVYRNFLEGGNSSLKHLKGAMCGLAQSCKRNPKLHKKLINKHKKEGQNPKSVWLDKVYLDKVKSCSPLKLITYDTKLILTTIWESLRGQGYKFHIPNLYPRQ
ncbi:MAG: sugar transferase [Candidatus Omnitrophota bacterium]